MRDLTHEYLLERLDYDSGRGHLIWAHRPKSHFKDTHDFKSWNARFSGKEAGTMSRGYIQVTIDYNIYAAHRLAWFHYHGYMPENQIDHKDRIRHHNWIDNLREATNQCNMINAGMLSNNKSGVKGVHFVKQKQQWVAYIKHNGKRFHLGIFKNFDDSVLKRWEGEKFYKFPNCCTSSSAYNYLKQKGLI